MINRDTLAKYILTGIVLCAAACMICLFVTDIVPYDDSAYAGAAYDSELITFNSNWTVTAEGYVECRPDSLPFVQSVPAGTAVTAVNTLPSAITKGTYIAFRNLYGFFDIYIGDELIYTSPLAVGSLKASAVPGWVFVPLSKDYSGRKIRIVASSPYESCSGIVPSILLGSHAEVLLFARDSCYLDLYISVSVIVLGLLVMLFAAFDMTAQHSRIGYMFLGIFISACGVFLITEVAMPRLSAGGYYAKYISGRFIMMLFPMLFSASVYLRDTEKTRKIFLTLSAVSFFTAVACVAAFFTGLADFELTSIAVTAVMLASVAAAFYLGVLKDSSAGIYYRILSGMGLVSLAAGTVMENMHRFEIYTSFIHIRNILFLLFALTHAVSVAFMAYAEAAGREKTARELAESRMKLMMSQIQPHFIHNTLSTIRAMIPSDPKKAYDMIYDFSRYLKFNISSLGDVPIIPFEEELKHIQVYTQIETLRFGDKVQIVYDIGDVSFSVPPLAVQPFVENAVKHGVCRKRSGGTVRISSAKDGDYHVITIEDDGAGFDISILERSDNRGVGIKNATYRLENQVDAKVTVASTPGEGTFVTIRIPQERRSVENENNTGG